MESLGNSTLNSTLEGMHISHILEFSYRVAQHVRNVTM